ncbi:hypothetical protein BU17DRAFT_58328, partial [Hysterangium stoloniferum]
CSRCKFTYYCSPDCQKVDLKAHNDTARLLNRIETLKKIDPETAEMEFLWHKWCREAFHNSHRIHALGVHRNLGRGKTHILFEFVEYTPKASKDFRYKFRVVACSVFRIILVDIEKFMRLDPGEGEEYVNGLIQPQIQNGRWPMLHFVVGNGLPPWLSAGIHNFKLSPKMLTFQRVFHSGGT